MGKTQVYSNSRQKFITDPYRASYYGERWEQIYDTPYYVSNYGRVYKKILLSRFLKTPRKIKPFTRRKPGWRRKLNVRKIKRPTYHMIHPTEKPGGCQLAVWKEQQRTHHPYIQHLVADLFQLREPGEKVLFRDGDEWNPKLSNLKVKGKHGLSARQRKFCKELFAKYPSNIIIPELALRFMAGHTTIWRVYKEYEKEIQMLSLSQTHSTQSNN